MAYVTPHIFDTAYQLTTSSGDELASNLVSTIGLTELGDGEGGVFAWAPASEATDDGVDVIQPSSVTGAGRWIRVSGTPTGGGTFTGNVTIEGDLTVEGTTTLEDGVTVTTATTNAAGGTFTGDGTGAGVFGQGGSTSGTGVTGSAGGPNGVGVLGQGQGAGSGVLGSGGATGAGIYGLATNGYGVVAESDTTSPTRAALRIVPQDTQPTTGLVGDTYYTSAGILRKCVVAGTPGTWSNVGVEGTATNDNALAGNIGEIITATAALDSVGSWTTDVAQNVTSISLTAGDWDVWGQIAWAGATTGTYTIACISTTSATLQGDETTQGYSAIAFQTQANSRFAQMTGPYRASLAATTTIYLVGQEGFTVGTPLVGGTLRARRVR